MKRLFLLVIALAFAALAVAGCGGSSESDEDKIVSVVETSALSTDPADCKATQTVAFMEQANEGEGKKAVEECEENADDTSGTPDSVVVSKVDVADSAATADVAFTGGSFDGQTVVLGLVEEGGDWKLDEIKSFAKLDREKLIGAFETSIEETEELAPELGECLVEGFEAASDSELEDAILNGPEGVVQIAEECTE
jgi:hypothetical protein